MPPPWTTNPAPKTESAHEARKNFYCTLCQKGYSRINELEAHEGSYDHTHRKRLKDLKHLTRASGGPTTTTTNDSSGGPGISIKPISLGEGKKAGGGGFKKGGFRNAFSAVGGGVEEEKGVVEERRGVKDVGGVEKGEVVGEGAEKDDDDDDDGRWGDYDPRLPTGCGEWCAGRGR